MLYAVYLLLTHTLVFLSFLDHETVRQAAPGDRAEVPSVGGREDGGGAGGGEGGGGRAPGN